MSEPTVRYAIFCSDVERKGDSFSILGVIDGIKKIAKWEYKGQQPPKEFPAITIPIKLLICLENIDSGKHKIWMVAIQPSGEREQSSPLVEFLVKPDTEMQRVLVNSELNVVENGPYTFRIILDGDPLKEIKLPIEIHHTIVK